MIEPRITQSGGTGDCKGHGGNPSKEHDVKGDGINELVSYYEAIIRSLVRASDAIMADVLSVARQDMTAHDRIHAWVREVAKNREFLR